MSLIDYRRESIDLAPSLMNITRNFVQTGRVANISIMLFEYMLNFISSYRNHITHGRSVVRTELIVARINNIARFNTLLQIYVLQCRQCVRKINFLLISPRVFVMRIKY